MAILHERELVAIGPGDGPAEYPEHRSHANSKGRRFFQRWKNLGA
jgi:hypothetical protein